MTLMQRGSGILLHVTSLPSNFGIGDLGPEAYAFADFLHESGQSFWQILPLNPTDLLYDSSPYHSISTFAGNPLLISPELLARDGLLQKSDLKPLPAFPEKHVDYDAALQYKKKLFHLAFERFQKKNEEYEKFCLENSPWLDDFALFVSLKSCLDRKAWNRWPKEIRDRDQTALNRLRKDLCEQIEMEKFLQFIFSRQWFSLKDYCNRRGIRVFGDLPIYVVHDSADVWKNPQIFKLDKKKKPYAVAGVPPDYFSKTGQRWGNPVYNWEELEKQEYGWWFERLRYNLTLFDFLRIDHFRGLVSYWEVPAGEKTAVKGKWIEAPAEDFFGKMVKQFDYQRIIAEDLGTITPDVVAVKERFGFAGMKILLFAFGDDFPNSSYLPHNVEENCIFYTGTHDNNTIQGWFESEATQDMKKRVVEYTGQRIPKEEIHREFIRLVMDSAANMVIIPMQDILGLDGKARMNRPATKRGNWRWRLTGKQITSSLTGWFRKMTETHGRC